MINKLPAYRFTKKLYFIRIGLHTRKRKQPMLRTRAEAKNYLLLMSHSKTECVFDHNAYICRISEAEKITRF
ncbi:hypothetical protein GCM10028825_00660 [Spirosoma agri]